ncbi:unnamed protein product [Closterium sp. Naga37s-1]|nr:unnamed protein product [Closterium sp. Naga37s-1]
MSSEPSNPYFFHPLISNPLVSSHPVPSFHAHISSPLSPFTHPPNIPPPLSLTPMVQVEMADSADAKRAFKGHVSFPSPTPQYLLSPPTPLSPHFVPVVRHVPLYLEWAPEGIFLEPAAPSDTPAQATTTAAAAASREAGGGAGEGGAREGKERGGVKSIKRQGAVGLLPVVVDGKAARRMAAEAEMVGGVAGGRDGEREGTEGHAAEGEEDGQLSCLPFHPPPPLPSPLLRHPSPQATPTSHSVFVKNLRFATMEEQLKEHPEKLSPFSPSPCMPAHKPQCVVKNLSFATTETQLKEHLEKLLRSKHAGGKEGPSIRSVMGTVLDGHALLLQLSKGEIKGGEGKGEAAWEGELNQSDRAECGELS